MKKILLSAIGLIVLFLVVAAVWIALVLSRLPDVALLKHYRPAAAAEVLDKDGLDLAQYYDRTFRLWVPIANLPDIVVQAVVTAEDDTFFEHQGVNFRATWEALIHDLHKRKFARGGSTITQQMIKNVLLSKEKTISRKVREYVLARKAEELLTKRRILEIYLNVVEWGENVYGIEAASRTYLGKHASEMNPAEAAYLAGMLPNPRYYNPYKHPDKARDRQERVLFNMQQAKLISQDEYTVALQTTITFQQQGQHNDERSSSRGGPRPCYQVVLEQVLLKEFGDQELYRSGRIIRTTIDKGLQMTLAREDAAPGDAASPVIVVTQGGLVRALVCDTNKERLVRDLFELPGSTYSGYEVSMVAPELISSGKIVQNVPASDGPL